MDLRRVFSRPVAVPLAAAVLAAVGLAASAASAQSTGSFPPMDESSPPPEQAPPPSSQPGAGVPSEQAPPPGPSQPSAGVPPGAYAPPPAPSAAQPEGPPLRAAGQSLGPYQRPEGAAMPGDGLAERAAPRGGALASDYRHDGFYLRLAGGIGTATDSQSTDVVIPTERNFRPRLPPQPYEGSASGLAPGTQIAVGFTPLGGLTLGVMADTATILSATADVPDPNTGNYAYRTSQFALFSAFSDFYFDPELGVHVQGGLGLATYVAGVGDPENPNGPRAQAHTALGFGFMLGAGYEWFVSRQWSAGLLARLLWGTTSGQDPKGVDWSHQTLSPAVMVGLTYH